MSDTSPLFYFFGALAAISALGLLLSRNVLHGALLMIVCLLSLAGIYVLAFAEFVAVTQILLYAGGILIIIIFGIMLTSKISGKPLTTTHGNIFSGVLAATAMLVMLSFSYFQYADARDHSAAQAENIASQGLIHPEESIRTLGTLLMSEFLLPFEMIGLLLLIALVGASVTATSSKTNSHDAR